VVGEQDGATQASSPIGHASPAPTEAKGGEVWGRGRTRQLWGGYVDSGEGDTAEQEK
jgi:hypothetical protein